MRPMLEAGRPMTRGRGVGGPIGVLALAALLGWGAHGSVHAAAALADAQSLVGVGCYNDFGNDNGSAGPLPVGLSMQCDWTGTSPQGRWGTASWQASASAHTGLAGLGVADGVAHASATNVRARVDATAGGWVSFAWRLDPLAAPPFVPDTLPVRFRASGEGHLNGDGPWYGGRITASATLDLVGFPAADYRFDSGEQYFFGALDRQFGGSTTLQVLPGQTLSGRVHANCWVVTIGSAIDGELPLPLTSRAECSVVADPILGLDQAAFVARYGDAAFNLADYYRVSVSPNVPVPEPATAVLWLAALAAAAVRRGRSRLTGRT